MNRQLSLGQMHPTVKLAQLFADWCKHTKKCQDTKSCKDRPQEQRVKWTCCDTHKALGAAYEELKKRAEEIGIRSDFPALTTGWWWNAGFFIEVDETIFKIFDY